MEAKEKGRHPAGLIFADLSLLSLLFEQLLAVSYHWRKRYLIVFTTALEANPQLGEQEIERPKAERKARRVSSSEPHRAGRETPNRPLTGLCVSYN
jgi:hypothetical protein